MHICTFGECKITCLSVHISKKERRKFIDDKFIKYPVQLIFIELMKSKIRKNYKNKIWKYDKSEIKV